MASSRAGQEPWRVGVLFWQTGATAVVEEGDAVGGVSGAEQLSVTPGSYLVSR